MNNDTQTDEPVQNNGAGLNSGSSEPARKKKGMSAGKLVFLILVFLMTSVLFAYVIMTGPRNPEDEEYIAVTVPEGTSADSIGQQLEYSGVVNSGLAFSLYSRIHGLSSGYKAGTYSLQRSMSVGEIAGIIASGKTNNQKFVVIEGYQEYETGAKLAAEGIVDETKFRDIIEKKDFTGDYDFLSDAQQGEHRLEGYLFPNTYELPLGSTEEDVVRTLLDGFDAAFTQDLRDRAAERNLTINQAVIIASIIERETADDGDRARIASVIYNRLEKKMALQMCSTVNYAMSLDGIDKKLDLTNVDTGYNSPYNTYLHKGLPPGPICSPGLKSIEAALYPADTDYLYFVLDDSLDGKSKFSSDEETFEKDVEAYAKAKEKQQS